MLDLAHAVFSFAISLVAGFIENLDALPLELHDRDSDRMLMWPLLWLRGHLHPSAKQETAELMESER